ncbi:copper homeostasis protein CutC [Asticcacaulis solisilvae]|uniref:copper homeostasis protein CutC n=1 Tax=Asticcacaulis solisilvae TaxID=1217274 RepID=UPI003FD76FF9
MSASAHRRDGIVFEVVTDTIDGVRAAVAGGADRIELVSALAVGGVTPSPGFMRQAARCGVPVRAMVRPRPGDFCYDSGELDIMRHDIEAARAAGMAGVVFGANLPSGELDLHALGRLCAHASALGLETALHRSFDLAPDALEALDAAISLGIATVLTSGGAATAREGTVSLRRLVTYAAGRVEVLAGVGITAANVADIVVLGGVASVHASCATAPEVTEGLVGRLRTHQMLTDANAVTAVRYILDSINSRRGAQDEDPAPNDGGDKHHVIC